MSGYPQFESEVIADMTISELKADKVVGQQLADKKDWEIVVGVRPVLPDGLEEVIMGCKQGDSASLDVNVDGQDYRYNVTVKQIKTTDVAGHSGAERLAMGTQRKEDGNAFFEGRHWLKAVRKYERAAEFLQELDGVSDEDKAAGTKVLQASYTNAAQAYLNLAEWEKAIKACGSCLDVDASNVKALFRRGCANSALRNWDEASECFTKVIEIDGGFVADAQRELDAVNHMKGK
jgi:hypothetical protein